MQYPLTVPFMRNKIPYSPIETPKTHASKRPLFGKMWVKNPQLCPFTELSTLFLLYRPHAFIF